MKIYIATCKKILRTKILVLEEQNCTICGEKKSTIMFKIFCHFLMVKQFLFSPQLKRSMINWFIAVALQVAERIMT